MNYLKSWNKFIIKLNSFSSISENDWTYYQLLGYLMSKTNSKIEPVIDKIVVEGYETITGHEPSRHPDVEMVRWTYNQFNKDIIKTKKFIDWSLDQCGTKLKPQFFRRLFQKYSLTQEKSAIIESIHKRSDELPINIQEIFKKDNIKTYGNLSLFAQVYLEIVTNKLKELNIDIKQLHLEKII